MKSFVYSVLSILLLVSLAVGFNGLTGGKENLEYSEAQKIAYTQVHYQDLPEDIKGVIDKQKLQSCTRIFKGEGDSQYLFIALGERRTGGYGIEIKSVEAVEGRVTVIYREIKPEEGAFVTQAFTYPYVVLKIDSPFQINVITG